MGDADPKAHSFGIAAETIVARQGDDAAPSGTQGHAGHQKGSTCYAKKAAEAIQWGFQVIMQRLETDFFVYDKVWEYGQKYGKHQDTRTT